MTRRILISAFLLATCCHESFTSELTEKPPGDGSRKRRMYSYVIPDYNVFSKWKPFSYSLSRPYVIPIYGAEGRPPVYFPPQPFFISPAIVPGNVINKNPFMGPQYLPPKRPTTGTTDMKVGNRFQDTFDEDDDSRPVWGAYSPSGTSPSVALRPSFPPSNDDIPSGVNSAFPPAGSAGYLPPPPPKGNGNFIPLVIDENTAEEFRPSQKPSTTTTTTATTTAPQLTTTEPSSMMSSTVPSSTTSSPAPPTSIRPGPSTCVWAVVSCCSAATEMAPESCFEQRGCPGPFWGSSPCSSDFAKAAIAAALEYYGS